MRGQAREAGMARTTVSIVESVLKANDQLAAQNRARLDAAGIFGLNVMASPGAGKTSLILRTIEALAGRLRIGVVEGDTTAVTIDAERVAARGLPAVQVNTAGSCHLDAAMVGNALAELPLAELDLVIVENVGNLVCPAGFALGAHASVAVASIPEGDDKPYKYPRIYRGLDALVLNKVDLAPYVRFDEVYFRRGVEELNPDVAYFALSCETGVGIPAWAEWVAERCSKARAPRA
jgi:hydrogenase nickel incorporation protein HypB